MNYERIYSEFIADRLTKQPVKPAYFEKHHIVPKCKGGGNEKENIISLTVEDHIHAHILLAKIYGGQMWGAALLMTKATVGRTRSLRRIPSKDEIRAAAFAKKMFSIHCRGENHHAYGKKMSDSARNKMSVSQTARAEAGLHWAQQNPQLLSGANSWLRRPENAAAIARAMPKFKANLQKAAIANMGDGNVMHRPEVKAKIRASQKQHWENGTGAGSEAARLKRAAGHSTAEYLQGASDRVSGEKNPSFGLTGGKNYNSRQVLCVEKNEIFDSVRDAVGFCGGDVTKAARTGGTAGGYHWRRLSTHSTDGRITKNGKSQKETGPC